MSKKTGFTIIELLVVIAIIAILAAILFPVFARAREKARATSCLSNVKQIALAVQMYLGDWGGVFPIATWNRDRFPGGWPTYESPPPSIKWGLLRYLENDYRIFACPSDNCPAPLGTWGYPMHNSSYVFGEAHYYDETGAYGVNRVDYLGNPVELIPALQIGDIYTPTSFVIVQEDHRCIPGWEDTVEAVNTRGGLFMYRPDNNDQFPHNGRGSYSFADGHAESLDWELLCTHGWDYLGIGIVCNELAHRYTLQYAGPIDPSPVGLVPIGYMDPGISLLDCLTDSHLLMQ